MRKHVKKIVLPIIKKVMGNKYEYYKIKAKSNYFRIRESLNKNEPVRNDLTDEPLVSIIMTVYNREKYLKYAIESVLNQSYKNFELIIVNDGSTDNSEEVIRSYSDNRIRYYHKENSGQLDTFKFAYSKAKGEFITRLDSDDMFNKDAVLTYINSMLQNENASFAYCDLFNIDENNNIVGENRYSDYSNHKEVLTDIFSNFYSVIPDVALWKRDYLKHVLTNYIDENVPFYIDNVLSVQYVHVNKPLYEYRVHNSNFVSNVKNLNFVVGGIIKTIDIIVRRYNFNEYMNLDQDITKAYGYALIADRYIKEAKKYIEGSFGNFLFKKEDKIYESFLKEAAYWFEKSLDQGEKIEIHNNIAEEFKSLEYDYKVSAKKYTNINKRALIVSADNPYGGKSVGGKHIHIYLLQEGLKANKITNDIVAYDDSGNHYTDLIRLSQKYNLDINSLKTSKDIAFLYRIYDIQEQLEKRIAEYINENFATYINCHDVIATAAVHNVLKKLGRNIPIITTLHGYFTYENVDYGGLQKDSYIYKFLLEYERNAYEVSDEIIAVDTRIRDYVLNTCKNKSAENITIIKNAINNLEFKPIKEEERLEMLKYNDINHNMVFVPRRLVPKNGVIYVVKAIKYAVDKGFKDFQLVVAGDGPERPAIEEFIGNSNIGQYVKLLGDVTHDKILEYFKMAKVVVVPSVPSNDVQEATSLSALEGMACGKVVIATAIGGLKEIIKDGEDGYLVESKNIEQLGEKIVNSFNLNEKEYADIAEHARLKVERNHGFIEHANRFLAVYDKCLH